MILPKYRAWDYNDKKMWKVVAMSESIYGDCEESYIKVCEFDKSPRHKETDIRLSFNFDLMQFTGLYDKNQKPIFEGDIVETELGKGVVVFDSASFLINILEDDEYYSFEDFFSLYEGGCYLVEVIGNIFEHKHLLEGTE